MAGQSKDEVFLDEPWLSIWWDSQHECVRAQWKAFANSAEFRAGMLKVLQAIREKHAVRYVSDTRKVKVIVQEDQRWMAETLIPQVAAAGIKRFGLVTAKAGLGKVIIEDGVESFRDRAFLMHHFDTLDAAMRWVAQAD